jgi:transcription elongation factor GreA
MEETTYWLSHEKVDELRAELKELETKGRKEVADNLDWLRGLPNDLDDVTFSDVLEDKSSLEKRISEIKHILNNFKYLEANDDSHSVVIGSTVKVGFEGYEQQYQIVSALEANPLENRISDESPVGKALLGASVGDLVQVSTEVLNKEFRILDIK